MSTTHLAVVEQPFDHSQQTQLNVSSFLCNFRSPSAVSPLQLTTSAHRFPSCDFFSAFRSPLAWFASTFFPSHSLLFRSTPGSFRLLDITVFPFIFYPILPDSGSFGAQGFLTVCLFSPFCTPGFPCLRPVLITWLSVGFLSSYPASLPQLFHWCSFRFRFLFPHGLAFFRPLTFRFRLLSLLFLFFPFLPFLPHSGFSGVSSAFRLPLFRFPSAWCQASVLP